MDDPVQSEASFAAAFKGYLASLGISQKTTYAYISRLRGIVRKATAMGLSVDEPSLDHLMGLQGAWSPQEVTVLAWLRKFFEVQKATERFRADVLLLSRFQAWASASGMSSPTVLAYRSVLEATLCTLRDGGSPAIQTAVDVRAVMLRPGFVTSEVQARVLGALEALLTAEQHQPTFALHQGYGVATPSAAAWPGLASTWQPPPQWTAYPSTSPPARAPSQQFGHGWAPSGLPCPRPGPAATPPLPAPGLPLLPSHSTSAMRTTPTTTRTSWPPSSRPQAVPLESITVLGRPSRRSGRRRPRRDEGSGEEEDDEEEEDESDEEDGDDEENDDDDEWKNGVTWGERRRSQASLWDTSIPHHRRDLGDWGVIGAAVCRSLRHKSQPLLIWAEVRRDGPPPGAPPIRVPGVSGTAATEAARVAYSWVWMNLDTVAHSFNLYGVRPLMLRPGHAPLELHMTPHIYTKAGPSLAAAFAMALLSFLLGCKVRHSVALTGEIDLAGLLTKVGGLHDKSQAVGEVGARTLICPLANARDKHVPSVPLRGVRDLSDVAGQMLLPPTNHGPPPPYHVRGLRDSAYGIAHAFFGPERKFSAEVTEVEAAVMMGQGEVVVTGNVSSCLEVGIRRAVSWVMDHLHLLPNHGVTDFQPSELQVHVHVPSLHSAAQSTLLELPAFAALVFALRQCTSKPDVVLCGELDRDANLLRLRGVSEVDVQCLEALESVRVMVVHTDNVRAWRDAIDRYGSASFKARGGVEVVGARHALDAIQHAAIGRGPQGMFLNHAPLTRI